MADDGEAQKVVPVSLELSPRARDVVTSLKQQFGVTQKNGVEMGLEFLSSLPPTVLREVFRRGGDPAGELFRIRMAEIAGAGEASTLEQAFAIARAQLEKAERIALSYRRELEDQGQADTSKKKRPGKAARESGR